MILEYGQDNVFGSKLADFVMWEERLYIKYLNAQKVQRIRK